MLDQCRYFPYVVNLACQAFLSELKANPYTPVVESSPDPALQQHREDYASRPKNDPVGNVRAAVAACRSSGQRHHDLKMSIVEGNGSGKWKGKLPEGAETLQLFNFYETMRRGGLLPIL